jgi:hypothetical protein
VDRTRGQIVPAFQLHGKKIAGRRNVPVLNKADKTDMM